jgi:predicted transcriptional regulator
MGNNSGELRLQRFSAKIAQQALARAAGIEHTRLCRIELGWVEPEPEELERLWAALAVLIARGEVSIGTSSKRL